MKNTAIPALLFSALAAAIPFQHEHAQHHHKRAYQTVTELTTLLKVVTLDGPLPAGATVYSPEEIAELTKNVVQAAAKTRQRPAPPAASDYSSIVEPAEPSIPPVAPPAPPPPAVTTDPAPVPSNPPPPPPPAVTTDPAPVPSNPPPPPSSAVTTKPAPVPSDTPTTPGGTGGANPFYPNGPKVGEKVTGVRLSPFLTYWTGASIENHIGACGKKPYSDTDPQLSKSDSKGDKKFMFHPPVISGDKYTDILQYCGAIIDVTTPDGLTTTGTVVDLCEDCGGPGGIDMLKANWDEVGKNVTPGDCVFGASWVLSGWINLLPSLS